jgi:hypothetical protein
MSTPETKMVYAVAVIGDDESRKVLIYRHKDGDGWHFPGDSIALSTNGGEAIRKRVMESIDGITIISCELIETFTHDGQENEIYFILCGGNPLRHNGLYEADFKNDLDSYLLSTTGRKVRAIFNRRAKKPKLMRYQRMAI